VSTQTNQPWESSLPLATTLQERSHFGHGYKNESLETKRRHAIQWLRTASKTGWVMDRTIRFMHGETYE